MPTADYNGPDSFSYKLSDGSLQTALATVTLTVTSVNDVPQAVADAHNVNEDTTLTIAAPGVLANDTNGDGLPLTTTIVSQVEFGTLTLNADGGFVYTPDADFQGVDSFTYQATDGTDPSATTTVTITVVSVPDAPTVGADSYNLDTNQFATLNVPAAGVLSNDDDVDGDTLTAINASTPANGVVVLNADGSFTYTPNIGFIGTDSFTYEASDGTLTTQALVTINVSNTAGGEGEGRRRRTRDLIADEEGRLGRRRRCRNVRAWRLITWAARPPAIVLRGRRPACHNTLLKYGRRDACPTRHHSLPQPFKILLGVLALIAGQVTSSKASGSLARAL
jgi:VCBS repeat-containing protein